MRRAPVLERVRADGTRKTCVRNFLARGRACGGPALAVQADPRSPRDAALDNRELTISKREFLAFDAEQAAHLIRRRYDAVRAAGCDAEAAVVVAVHPEVAIGDAVDLLRRGFAPRTALAILMGEPRVGDRVSREPRQPSLPTSEHK